MYFHLKNQEVSKKLIEEVEREDLLIQRGRRGYSYLRRERTVKMIELNETLVGRGTVLSNFAQHSIKGSPFPLIQIFAKAKTSFILITLNEMSKPQI